MSGIAGGDRILRKDVQPTVDNYERNVLSKFPEYKGYIITGSYNGTDKDDFGDIDLIVTVSTDLDKKEIKRKFADFLQSLPSNVIMPFPTGRAAGKRTYNSGEIITALIKQANNNLTVQVDNMFSLSLEESDFKKTFLNLPANVQGLIIGLVRTAWLEYGNYTLKKLGIPIQPLDENQEYEFVLSSTGLSLRVYTYDENYKETNRQEIWRSRNWNDVLKLFPEERYNFEAGFDSVLSKINFNNPRSKGKLQGLYTSMITVKSGEVGTDKGKQKELSKKKLEDYLNKK